MFYCGICGEKFNEPHYEVYTELHTELDSGNRYEEKAIAHCPNCESVEIEEVYQCQCGEGCRPDMYYCDTCHAEVEEYLNWIQDEMGITRGQLDELLEEHEQWITSKE
jgi:hypothetical protein